MVEVGLVVGVSWIHALTLKLELNLIELDLRIRFAELAMLMGGTMRS